MKRFLLCSAFATMIATPLSFGQSGDGQVVQDRTAWQDARIAQGEKSGEITKGEAAHLDKGEDHIDREVARDKAKNGGTLTKGEKVKVHHQMKKESKAIAEDKHNDRVQ